MTNRAVDQLARELQESNRQLRLAQKIARIGNWSLDPQIGVPEWSEEIYRIYERDPALGPYPLEEYARIYAGRWWETFREAIRGAIDEGRPYDIELRLTLPSGKVKWVHAICEPESRRGPRGHRVHGTIQDISARKEAEDAHRRLQDQLTRAQRLEAVGRLAGGVAHDFNNVLSLILGHAELLLDGLAEEDPSREAIETIHGAARRAADLTQQLLTFASRQTVRPTVLDLNAAVDSMFRMLDRLLGENVNLQWRPGDGLAPVRMDPSQVDQILVNLAINARDAIEDVGTITIATSRERLSAEDRRIPPWVDAGEYVVLSVGDDGRGMDQDTLGRAFEPFFTTKDADQGTGLGLATVYGIVKQNGGFIHVDSAPGRGSEFRLYLPVCEESEVARRPHPAGPARSAARGCTILLVEDEPAILSLGTTMLRQAGHEVLAANTPGQAIEMARAHTGGIDLLISDVVMPEMNGRELAERLTSVCPNLKQLFVSGYDEGIVAKQGIVPADIHFLQKPISRDTLIATVDEILGG